MDKDKIKEFIRQHYLKLFDREPDKEGLDYYYSEIINEKIKPNELKKIFENSIEGKTKSKEKELSDKMDNIMLQLSEENNPYGLKEQEEKIESVFISCLNPETGFGGIYNLVDDKLAKPRQSLLQLKQVSYSLKSL